MKRAALSLLVALNQVVPVAAPAEAQMVSQPDTAPITGVFYTDTIKMDLTHDFGKVSDDDKQSMIKLLNAQAQLLLMQRRAYEATVKAPAPSLASTKSEKAVVRTATQPVISKINASLAAISEAKSVVKDEGAAPKAELLQATYETIHSVLYPVWASCGGLPWYSIGAKTPAELVDKEKRYRPEVRADEETIRRLSSSVGMITVMDVGAVNRVRNNVGTAVSVGKHYVMTNRHVLLDGMDPLVYRQNRLIDPKEPWMIMGNLKLTVSFPVEYDRCVPGALPSRQVHVKSVKYMSETHDFAILETEEDAPDPIAFPSDEFADNGDWLVIIGYPIRPAEENTNLQPGQIDQLFRTPNGHMPYGVERFSLGMVGSEKIDEGYFPHDAGTIGGSSGSLVFDLTTHQVVGLHSGGFKARSGAGYNRAVAGSVIASTLSTLLR